MKQNKFTRSFLAILWIISTLKIISQIRFFPGFPWFSRKSAFFRPAKKLICVRKLKFKEVERRALTSEVCGSWSLRKLKFTEVERPESLRKLKFTEVYGSWSLRELKFGRPRKPRNGLATKPGKNNVILLFTPSMSRFSIHVRNVSVFKNH